MYESDITRFLKDLKQQKPQLEEAQKKGRAIWWDKPVDLDAQRRYGDARVPQQPYVYQNK
jgi:hypothetical protein